MENERLICWEVPGVGKVAVVDSNTDGLSDAEIQKRWDSFQRVSRRLYRESVARKMQESKA